ncbi:hypothetical protein BN1723_008056 [Verticillium longisporum]|uniref:Uncharacterized protein n=1 Tax=Verticillium longisporum TaxID=100787 RepID=A0A0G4NQA9_VERLO|nr:hypothetical protein BN1723_008056 [Verticillium longisporum]
MLIVFGEPRARTDSAEKLQPSVLSGCYMLYGEYEVDALARENRGSREMAGLNHWARGRCAK